MPYKNKADENTYWRRRYREDPEVGRRKHAWARRNKKRVQLTERARLLRKQEQAAGRPRPEGCDVCGKVVGSGKGKIAFDHDHVTGQFRGWLCATCNLALGCVKDDVTLLLKLADYLDKHRINAVA
jgi:hypothetical protein